MFLLSKLDRYFPRICIFLCEAKFLIFIPIPFHFNDLQPPCFRTYYTAVIEFITNWVCIFCSSERKKKIKVTASLNSKKFWFFPTNRINDLVYFSSHQLISNISSCVRKLHFTFKMNTSLFQFFYFFFHFLIACKKFLMRNCMQDKNKSSNKLRAFSHCN